MDVTPSRRALLAALASLVVARPALAEEIHALEWDDLLPDADRASAIPNGLRAALPHDENDLAAQQPRSSGVRTDWNGRTVELDGFVVPLEPSAKGLTAFLLAPFVGACIHVPPPPANQLVFVTTERPWPSDGLFEPVTVTGMFGTTPILTQLAAAGYVLSADRIRVFEG